MKHALKKPVASSQLRKSGIQGIVQYCTAIRGMAVFNGNSIKAMTQNFRKKFIVFAGMTEAEVIARAQAGDTGCFEALYGRHKQRVFSLCRRMTGSHDQAEDCTQEAFLQLFRKISSFRGESAFSTWLHRLSVNIVLLKVRKKGPVEVSLDHILGPQQEDRPAKNVGLHDNILDGAIDRILLEQALGELSPGCRMIFVLHDIEGYQHNEIAEILSCSIGSSKSQLHKARLKLRTWLLHNGNASPASRAHEIPLCMELRLRA